MTREEAIAAIEDIVESEFRGTQGLVGPGPRVLQALITLAPAVRYDRPTVEEVGGADRVWGKIGTSWMLTSGQELRRYWIGSKHTHPLVYPFTAWLRYTAIPEGGA